MLPVNGNVKYCGLAPEEGWFILTNLENLEAATA